MANLISFGEPAAEEPLHASCLANPPGNREDRSKFVVFARAMATLAAWRREGSLILDSEPALYGWPSHGLWIGLARLADLPETEVPRAESEWLLRRLEATRLHMEFPVFQASVPPEGDATPLGDGLHRLVPKGPWTAELNLVGGHAALSAAQQHRLNLGDRATGKGSEWMPLLAFTRTLDPISWPRLPKSSGFGNHGTGEGTDQPEAGRMKEELGIGWLYWSYGDFTDEGTPCV